MRWPLVLLSLLAGCDRCLAKPPPDVAADASADAMPTKLQQDSDANVSLLRWTDSRVAVSSTVDNPKDYPEHLIDGKLDTAWNGRTGDLSGFIAFRVPKVTRVASIHLTVGFDKGDLFTGNHRIARVKITHDGVVVKEVALDVDKRGLQAIPIGRAGGDYEIRILETKPGTNAKWKELVVSELLVLGDAGAARRSTAHLPHVRVGSLDAPESRFAAEPDGGAAPGNGPWPSIAAYCAAFEKLARSRPKKGDVYCSDIPPPSCAVGDRKLASDATPILSTGIVTTSDGYFRERSIAIETEQGWWTRMIGLDGADECQLGDFATTTASITGTKVVAPGAIAVEVETRTNDPQYVDHETGLPSMWVKHDADRTLHVCRSVPGVLRCAERHELGRFSGRLGDKEPPFETWKGRRAWRGDPVDGGTILLTP